MAVPKPYNTGLTEEQIAEAFRRAVNDMTDEQIIALIAEKVDKQEGFSLMSAEEHTKLSTLENYDDTEAKSEIALNRSTLGYQRKNLLKNTAVSKTQNGITFTVNADGSVPLNGTATAGVTLSVGQTEVEKGRIYAISGCPEGGAALTYRLDTRYYKNGMITTIESALDIGEGTAVTLPEDADDCRLLVYIRIGDGTNVDGLTFYPMLRYAEITDDTYEPYKDDLQTQIDNITTEKPYTLAAVYTRDLTSGEDLSKVTAPGVYRSATAAITNSLANKPDDLSSGFKMIVEVIQGASHILQTIKSQAGKTYIRHLNLTSGAADNWFSLVSSDELADLEARVAALEGGGT